MKNKRKVYLVNPKFQIFIITFFTGLFLLTTIIMFALVYFVFMQFLSKGREIGLPADHVYFQFVDLQINFFIKAFIPCAMLTLGIFIVGGLLLSHKIAGPIYRFTNFLKGLENSNYKESSVSFRQGDFFLEVSEEFNNFIKRLQ